MTKHPHFWDRLPLPILKLRKYVIDDSSTIWKKIITIQNIFLATKAGPLEPGCHSQSAGAGLLEPDCWSWPLEPDCPSRTPEPDRQNQTARTRLPDPDCQTQTVGTGLIQGRKDQGRIIRVPFSLKEHPPKLCWYTRKWAPVLLEFVY
jgi:hypothetical protein